MVDLGSLVLDVHGLHVFAGEQRCHAKRHDEEGDQESG